MKKFLSAIFIIVIFSFCFTACNSKTENKTDKLKVISTIFPGYDFAKQICGENAEVTMLLPPGSESHSYEPSAQDIINIQNCDLFIYVGGESDTWVDGVLSSMDKKIKTVKMIDCVNAVEEEHVEGMEAEREESGTEEVEYDEHVWTSPKNAVKISESITSALCAVDSANSEKFKSNSSAFISQLNKLDADFTEFFSTVTNKTIIFGDRFPLRYFVDAYGLKYYAAFPGCSSETEPSAATVAFLIDKVKTQKVTTVFYIEFSNHKVADSIAEATGTKTALFNTCHNISKADLNSGATYLSIMRKNLETLKEAMK